MHLKIGIDIMGGDFAPREAMLGAIAAEKLLTEGSRIVLIGDEQIARQYIAENNSNPVNFDFVHTTEVIEMSEHPTKAVASKKDSSINVGFAMLAQQKIDVFMSAGNTGAVMVGAVFSVKQIEGVLRPAVISVLPKLSGGFGIMVDAGTNADCKPEMLNQFAVLGSIFCEAIYNIQNPKVALMSVGEEKEKGNALTLATYPLLEQNPHINFIGNVEGYNLFDDKADVIVTDGFTGNILLKLAQSIYKIMRKMGNSNAYFDRFNYEIYGGSPVLGVNAPVLIGHGISNAEAFKNMILLGERMVSKDVTGKIKKELLSLGNR
jgi:glycerol-3-phosphate acyltransferase PlsX